MIITILYLLCHQRERNRTYNFAFWSLIFSIWEAPSFLVLVPVQPSLLSTNWVGLENDGASIYHVSIC
jgi:hypothetical protein